MKYYCIMTHTPYVGENSCYYFAAESEDDKDLMLFANACVFENANEWYDARVEKNYSNLEDYLNECGYTIGEVDYEEYIQYK